MRQPEYAALRLEDRHVDVLACEVAKRTGAALLVAHAPRAMLDLNRSKEDIDWEMIRGRAPTLPRHSHTNRRARSGLGLVPRRLPGFGEIWKAGLSKSELDARIEGIHRPYHTVLGRTLEDIRDAWGAVLLVDLHSMPPLRKRYDQEKPVQIVVGDRFGASCHGSLAGGALTFLETERLGVAHNRPYSGGFVLDRHSAPSRGIHSLQLEICRSAYLDADLSEPSKALDALADLLARLVRHLGDTTARLGEGGRFAQAAE